MTNLVAMFDSMEHAQMAVRELRDMGVSNADISLVAHDPGGEYGRGLGTTTRTDTTGDATATGAGIGAVLGGLTGLLVGLGALAIPGIGPVLAAGPLGTALGGLIGAGVGAVGGGVAGGLIGALVDMGLPEEEATFYAEGVRRGGALVTAKVADTMESRARDVFNRHGAVNIRERAEAWRRTGWTGYDANAKPYTREQADEERRAYLVGTGASTMSSMSTPPARPVNFSDLESGYRGHYQTNLARSGYQYEHYRPAYEYGYTLRNDERYRGWNWDRLESEARRGWESRYPGSTWDQIKMAVRHAWENVKQAVGDEPEQRRY